MLSSDYGGGKMAKFKEQFNSIIKEEKKKTHTRLIYELISIANNNGFINVYEGFSDIEKPDVLLSNERDYLFYGDAKLCRNKVINTNNAVEQISCHIDRFWEHVHDKLLPGGVIAIYTGGLIEKEECVSMLIQARDSWTFNFVKPINHSCHFVVAELHFNINMISEN